MNKKRAIDLNAGLGGRVYALKKAGFDCREICTTILFKCWRKSSE